jgi:hypothetical protein
VCEDKTVSRMFQSEYRRSVGRHSAGRAADSEPLVSSLQLTRTTGVMTLGLRTVTTSWRHSIGSNCSGGVTKRDVRISDGQSDGVQCSPDKRRTCKRGQ